MESEQFLNIVAEQLAVDKEKAGEIVSAVFHELHDRLTPREAADVAAQMPNHLKAMWTSFEYPGRAVMRTHREQFIREISDHAEIPEDEAAHATKVVFGALQSLLRSPTGQEGEAWDIFSQLPKDLKKIWLAAAQSGAGRRF